MFNTHYQPHYHPTTKSLWLCSSVYCRPPHQSRRIWLVAAATNQKEICKINLPPPPSRAHIWNFIAKIWYHISSSITSFKVSRDLHPKHRSSNANIRKYNVTFSWYQYRLSTRAALVSKNHHRKHHSAARLHALCPNIPQKVSRKRARQQSSRGSPSARVDRGRHFDHLFSPQFHPPVGYSNVKYTPVGYFFHIHWQRFSLDCVCKKISYLATILGYYLCKFSDLGTLFGYFLWILFTSVSI